ncbi:unnamed protein product [Amoebophrya sp. A120]|nr:unnamed protein product [Amoebophrya sp. A120]|eukprot:GSA120T00019040001.1
MSGADGEREGDTDTEGSEAHIRREEKNKKNAAHDLERERVEELDDSSSHFSSGSATGSSSSSTGSSSPRSEFEIRISPRNRDHQRNDATRLGASPAEKATSDEETTRRGSSSSSAPKVAVRMCGHAYCHGCARKMDQRPRHHTGRADCPSGCRGGHAEQLPPGCTLDAPSGAELGPLWLPMPPLSIADVDDLLRKFRMTASAEGEDVLRPGKMKEVSTKFGAKNEPNPQDVEREDEKRRILWRYMTEHVWRERTKWAEHVHQNVVLAKDPHQNDDVFRRSSTATRPGQTADSSGGSADEARRGTSVEGRTTASASTTRRNNTPSNSYVTMQNFVRQRALVDLVNQFGPTGACAIVLAHVIRYHFQRQYDTAKELQMRATGEQERDRRRERGLGLFPDSALQLLVEGYNSCAEFWHAIGCRASNGCWQNFPGESCGFCCLPCCVAEYTSHCLCVNAQRVADYVCACPPALSNTYAPVMADGIGCCLALSWCGLAGCVGYNFLGPGEAFLHLLTAETHACCPFACAPSCCCCVYRCVVGKSAYTGPANLVEDEEPGPILENLNLNHESDLVARCCRLSCCQEATQLVPAVWQPYRRLLELRGHGELSQRLFPPRRPKPTPATLTQRLARAKADALYLPQLLLHEKEAGGGGRTGTRGSTTSSTSRRAVLKLKQEAADDRRSCCAQSRDESDGQGQGPPGKQSPKCNGHSRESSCSRKTPHDDHDCRRSSEATSTRMKIYTSADEAGGGGVLALFANSNQDALSDVPLLSSRKVLTDSTCTAHDCKDEEDSNEGNKDSGTCEFGFTADETTQGAGLRSRRERERDCELLEVANTLRDLLEDPSNDFCLPAAPEDRDRVFADVQQKQHAVEAFVQKRTKWVAGASPGKCPMRGCTLVTNLFQDLQLALVYHRNQNKAEAEGAQVDVGLDDGVTTEKHETSTQRAAATVAGIRRRATSSH